MTWLTWRQHRRQFLFALVGLAVIAALIVPTGRQMHDAFVDTGLAECMRTLDRSEFVDVADEAQHRCRTLAESFTSRFGGLAPAAVLFALLPLLVGLFFGAPLVAREVEHGTHRLVWTQGVSRSRWALVKFGLIGAGTLGLAAAYTALVSWWVKPLYDATGDRFRYLVFDLQGVVPVAYTLFAVALGIFAGSVTRRVLPAMATTLVGFVGLRLAVTLYARPHFLPQRRRTFPITSEEAPNNLLGDWVLSHGVYDPSGRLIAANSEVHCTGGAEAAPAQTPAPPDPCLQAYGADAYNQQIYQPAERFWLFQHLEAGLYLALAAVLLVLAVRQVRRRIS